MTTFATTLRQLREARHLSQSRLALDAGFDHSYVSRLENESRSPSRSTVLALASAMNATWSERAALLESAGFKADPEPDVEAFRALPPEWRRALLVLVGSINKGDAA